MTHLTNHGRERMREREGLNKRAAKRMAQRALERGITHADTHGHLRRYLDGLYLAHRKANNLRIYGEFVYLFAGESLITVLNLPHSLRKMARP